ncbi:MAG TPA: GerMN domain-containing protein [Acidimicrobiales bacterium]|nr:GerMN domain-containing protein [Acidimicrobiales bacterium]
MKRLGLVVALGAVFVAACGVQGDPAPRDISAGRIPYDLLEDAPTTTTSAPTPSVPREPVLVYFVKNDRMIAKVRQVNAPASVPKALTALLFGVQEDEVGEGVRSAIDATAAVQARAVDPPGTYLVDLSPEFAKGPPAEQVLALAQIVYTATQLPNVTAVRFTLDGVPIEVPTLESGTTPDPVGRDAFAAFAELPDLGNPT